MTGPSDPDRRQFFRRFAGEVVRSAVSVVGAVEELRERSAAEAASLLRPDPEPDPAAVAVLDAPAPDQAAAAAATAAAATAAAATAAPAGPRVGSDGHVIPDPVPGEARRLRRRSASARCPRGSQETCLRYAVKLVKLILLGQQ